MVSKQCLNLADSVCITFLRYSLYCPLTQLKRLSRLSSPVSITTTSFSPAWRNAVVPRPSIQNAAAKITAFAHGFEQVSTSSHWRLLYHQTQIAFYSLSRLSVACPPPSPSSLIQYSVYSCLWSAHDLSLHHPLVTFSNKHHHVFSHVDLHAGEEAPCKHLQSYLAVLLQIPSSRLPFSMMLTKNVTMVRLLVCRGHCLSCCACYPTASWCFPTYLYPLLSPHLLLRLSAFWGRDCLFLLFVQCLARWVPSHD